MEDLPPALLEYGAGGLIALAALLGLAVVWRKHVQILSLFLAHLDGANEQILTVHNRSMEVLSEHSDAVRLATQIMTRAMAATEETSAAHETRARERMASLERRSEERHAAIMHAFERLGDRLDRQP